MKVKTMVRVKAQVSGWYLEEIEDELDTLAESVDAEDFEENQAYVLECLKTRMAYCQRTIDCIRNMKYEDVKGAN